MKKYLLLALVFFTAFCSFGIQTLTSFQVQILAGGDLFSWLIVMATYLCGLGIGGYRAANWTDKDVQKYLVHFEWGVSILCLLSILFIYLMDATGRVVDVEMNSDHLSRALVITAGMAFNLVLGILSGYELPAFIILSSDNAKTSSAILIASHYFGVLFASVLIPAVFIPNLDVIATGIVLSSINLLIFLILFIQQNLSLNRFSQFFIGAALILFVSFASSGIYQNLLKIHYFEPRISSLEANSMSNWTYVLQRLPKVERVRSFYQYIDTIVVPKLPDDPRPGLDTVLYLDGHLQFGSNDEGIYHELITHVPVQKYSVQPKNILILGGGDGIVLREIAKYSSFEHADLVELDQKIIDIAMTDSRFTELNLKMLQDPRVSVWVMDAFVFLKNNTEKYDFIIMDFPFPHSPDLSKLFSLEFFKLVQRALAPNGVLTFDFPIEHNAPELGGRNDVIFNTIQRAGFQNVIVFSGYDSFISAQAGSVFENTKSQLFMNSDLAMSEVKSAFISNKSITKLKLRNDLADMFHEDTRFVNSIFKPRSFGRDFQ